MYVGGSRATSSRKASSSPEGYAVMRRFILHCFCLKLCYCGKMKRSKKSVPLLGRLLWRREQSWIFVPRTVSLFLSDDCLMWNARKCHFFLWLYTQFSLFCLKACSKNSNYSLHYFWITSFFRHRSLLFLMSAFECNDLYTLEMTLKIFLWRSFFKDFFHRNHFFKRGKEKYSAEGCLILRLK